MAQVMCCRTMNARIGEPIQFQPIYKVIPTFSHQNIKTKINTVAHQKKVYYCQRCLNHDRAEPRKNHKCECPFAHCTCRKCILVEKRRKLNLRLHELEGDMARKEDEEDNDRKMKGERVPNCQKCGQHGRKSRLKGHKRVCPFRDCDCPKCIVVTERQKLMADQIKIRRRQRKDTVMTFARDHLTSTINALSAPFNLNHINALLYQSIKTSPQPLLSSPSSSDASSYSPSLQFPSPSMPLLLPSSSPESQSPTILTPPNAPLNTQQLIAPVAINPVNFPFGLTPDNALLQSLLAQYKFIEEAGLSSLSCTSSTSTTPIKEEDDGFADAESVADVEVEASTEAEAEEDEDSHINILD